MAINLSDDQNKALEAMYKWFKDWKEGNRTQQIFYLAGWAGTGKTTIANLFSKEVSNLTPGKDRANIMYGSFTGKAALRMRQAGMKNAQTLHSMIYRLERTKDNKPIFRIDPSSPLRNADLLILDECSMVDKELGSDVVGFNRPILILGDQGQLPPIRGQGYFTNRKPNAILKEVHRQALENPIIQLATDIRNGKSVTRFDEPNLLTFPNQDRLMEEVVKADQLLTGKNNTRNMSNSRMRELLFNVPMNGGDESMMPLPYERVICLRNNRKEGLFNGMIGKTMGPVVEEDDTGFWLITFMDEEGKDYYNIPAHPEGFINESALKDMDWMDKKEANEFTFGYCITVHKAQGSQWDNVVLLDDGFLKWDKDNRRKWMYTAVTRAAEKLVIAKV